MPAAPAETWRAHSLVVVALQRFLTEATRSGYTKGYLGTQAPSQIPGVGLVLFKRSPLCRRELVA